LQVFSAGEINGHFKSQLELASEQLARKRKTCGLSASGVNEHFKSHLHLAPVAIARY